MIGFERPWRRKNGFSLPYSKDQLLTIFFYILSTFINLSIILVNFQKDLCLILLLFSLVFIVMVLFNWFLASIIDPELIVDRQIMAMPTDSATSFPSSSLRHYFPFPTPSVLHWTVQRSDSYCIDCNKTIGGIDHHCSFLNNCISEKNYLYFFLLLIFASMQMIIHLFSMIGFAIGDGDRALNNVHVDRYFKHLKWLRYFAVAIQGLISTIFLFGLMALLCFHIYLICWKKKGTYDYILSRREKRLYQMNHDNEERSSNVSESRVQEIERQRQREKFHQEMEAARKKRYDSAAAAATSHLLRYEGDDSIGGTGEVGSNGNTLEKQNDSLPHIVMETTPRDHQEEAKKVKTADLFLGSLPFRAKGAPIHPKEEDFINHSPSNTKENDELSITVAQRHYELPPVILPNSSKITKTDLLKNANNAQSNTKNVVNDSEKNRGNDVDESTSRTVDLLEKNKQEG